MPCIALVVIFIRNKVPYAQKSHLKPRVGWFWELRGFHFGTVRRQDGSERLRYATRRYGFYAFPYAFHDAFYMVHKPASAPDSIMQYVRDERGRKITGRAIENYLKEYDLDGGVRARPAEGRSQAVPRPHTHAACAEPRHRRAAVHAADARHRPAQRSLPRRGGRQVCHLKSHIHPEYLLTWTLIIGVCSIWEGYLGGRLSPTAEDAARKDMRPPIGNAPIICFHHIECFMEFMHNRHLICMCVFVAVV